MDMDMSRYGAPKGKTLAAVSMSGRIAPICFSAYSDAICCAMARRAVLDKRQRA
jgi:hypothetical protein